MQTSDLITLKKKLKYKFNRGDVNNILNLAL